MMHKLGSICEVLSDLQLVKSMVMTCCALHNLCENHGETYETELTELDVQPAEPGVAVAQDVEGINVREGLMQFLLANN